ncbi:50S ribosomal protein L23 [Candidatus Pacearchaeota archaeon]|nr:50S ribosomal protein L23 [Candidatus Pacearchaeota archaeon]
MMKPLVTEKAVMMIEKDNVLTFVTDMKDTKESIKKYIEEILDVKVEKVRTLIRNNKKYAYIKLNKDNLAIDVATKLGLM